MWLILTASLFFEICLSSKISFKLQGKSKSYLIWLHWNAFVALCVQGANCLLMHIHFYNAELLKFSRYACENECDVAKFNSSNSVHTDTKERKTNKLSWKSISELSLFWKLFRISNQENPYLQSNIWKLNFLCTLWQSWNVILDIYSLCSSHTHRSRQRLRKCGHDGTWPLRGRAQWSAAATIMALLLLASTTTTAPAANPTWQEVVLPHAPPHLFQVTFIGEQVSLWSAHTPPSQDMSSVTQTHPYLRNLRTAVPRRWMIFR